MKITPPAYTPVTPAGKPVTVPPLPLPPTAYVIVVMAVLIHFVWLSVPAPDVRFRVASAVTVIDPVAVGLTQGPVVVTV